MMAVPSAKVLGDLANQYIEFHNAVLRAKDSWKKPGRYQFHNELDMLFHALNLWQAWDVGAGRLERIEGWPPHVGDTFQGAARFAFGLIEGWQWDLTTLDYPTVDRAKVAREAELKEVTARYNAAFEARMNRTSDDHYPALHAAVMEAEAEQIRLWRAPLVNPEHDDPATTTEEEWKQLRAWTLDLERLRDGIILQESANEAAAEAVEQFARLMKERGRTATPDAGVIPSSPVEPVVPAVTEGASASATDDADGWIECTQGDLIRASGLERGRSNYAQALLRRGTILKVRRKEGKPDVTAVKVANTPEGQKLKAAVLETQAKYKAALGLRQRLPKGEP